MTTENGNLELETTMEEDKSKETGGGMLIRDMAKDERPREKAMRLGVKALSDSELMAIIFGTGIHGKSVLDLCKEILADNDHHLSKVSRLTIRDFMNRYKGIGEAKAIAMLAALELGSRSATDAVKCDNPTIRSSSIAAEVMRHHFAHLPYEEFWVMLLSQSAKVIKEVCVSRGGLSMTAVDVKIILKHAIENFASAMILFHNHPSGTLSPSGQDDNLTRKICEGAKAIDVRVNDHIIITDAAYYSYNDEGRMP